MPRGPAGVVALGLAAALGCERPAAAPPPPARAPDAAPQRDTPVRAPEDPADVAIRYLERRAADDPADYVAHRKLAGYYLRRLRETSHPRYLELARSSARASLEAEPAAQNPAGLFVTAQVELAAHQFAAAHDHARVLIGMDPDASPSYQLLGDALLELGDYAAATDAYRRMAEHAASTPWARLDVETRLAQLDRLRGDLDAAAARLEAATRAAARASPVDREVLAWCHWQLGETLLLAGDYPGAERGARAALEVLPSHPRAGVLLARALAARGDTPAAIARYEDLAGERPDVEVIGALGDLYAITGRERDAAAKYELAQQLGELGAAEGSLHGRAFNLFRADHDRDVEAAHAAAVREHHLRRDVYGADAVAWTALKSGRIDAAVRAMEEALRLGTRDARLLFHAGMIARAAGDDAAARRRLDEALRLSPEFDPLQAGVARRALAELRLAG